MTSQSPNRKSFTSRYLSFLKKLFSGERFSSMESRPYRMLWLNTLLFSLARSAEQLVLSLYVIQRLEMGAAGAGAVVFAVGIPVLIVTIPAGVLADRIDKRTLLFISQIGSILAMALGAMLFYLDALNFLAIMLIAIFLGTTVALGFPARNALIPAVVKPGRLPNGIALMSIAQNFSQIGGPLLGGIAITLFDYGGMFIAMGTMLTLGLLSIIPIRIPKEESQDINPQLARLNTAEAQLNAAIQSGNLTYEEADTQRKQIDIRRKTITEQGEQKIPIRKQMIGDLKEGLSFVRGHREIFTLILLLVGTGIFMIGPFSALLQVVALDKHEQPVIMATLLYAIMGTSMVIGSFWIAGNPDFKNKGGWFLVTLMSAGIILNLMGQLPEFWMILPVMFIGGIAGAFFTNINQILIQKNTPQDMMGRVMGVHALGMMGVGPFGALLAGFLGSAVGVSAAMSISGVILFIMAGAALITQPNLRRMS